MLFFWFSVCFVSFNTLIHPCGFTVFCCKIHEKKVGWSALTFKPNLLQHRAVGLQGVWKTQHLEWNDWWGYHLVSKCVPVAVSAWWRWDKGPDSLGSGIRHRCSNSGLQHYLMSFTVRDSTRSWQLPWAAWRKVTPPSRNTEYHDSTNKKHPHKCHCVWCVYFCLVTSCCVI